MRLKLDENLGRRCAQTLLECGHDVATVPGQSLCSASDEALTEACKAESMCLVTLDAGFANPLSFPPHHYTGIAVLRAPPRIRPDTLAHMLQTLCEGLESMSIAGKLWIVEPGRIREYQPGDSSPDPGRRRR